jgi:uncharacterized phage protein (TIGR02218 family)
MREPSWETSPGALIALLNSVSPGQLVMEDLFTITLTSGTTLRYTSADRDITANGNTWAIGPLISRGKTKLTVGVDVDTMSMTVAADSTVTVNGVPMMSFIAAGGLDNARITLERVFAASRASAWVGAVELFSGRPGDIDCNRYEATFSVRSMLDLLTSRVPRNIYQAGCGNTLYDGACGISRAGRGVSGAATGPTDAARTSFLAAALQGVDGYFDLGVVTMTSGANAGHSRTVKSHAAYRLTVISPWPFAVAAGDTFNAFPGCNKTKDQCAAKFNNLARFRGFPFIPVPETVT